MIQYICSLIYVQPLSRIVEIMLLSPLLWYNMRDWFENKLQTIKFWKIFNGKITIITIIAIFVITLSSRESSRAEMILIPFHSFIKAQTNREIYRSMLMNVFLFFPLGLSLPFALPESWRKKGRSIVLFSMGLAIGIEYLQYRFQLGWAEIDDVLCNTFGALLGVVANKLSGTLSKR